MKIKSLLFKLKNGSWIDLSEVTRIIVHPKATHDEKTIPPNVAVITAGAHSTITFDTDQDAQSYADDLAEMVNDIRASMTGSGQ